MFVSLWVCCIRIRLLLLSSGTMQAAAYLMVSVKVRHVPHVSNLLDAGVTFATIIASSLKQLFMGQALWGFSTVLTDTCE